MTSSAQLGRIGRWFHLPVPILSSVLLCHEGLIYSLITRNLVFCLLAAVDPDLLIPRNFDHDLLAD